MGAFGALLLAHLLGDFPCQPYPLIRWKLSSARGLAVHVAIQTALVLPVMIRFVPRWGWWLLLLAASHYAIDWVKVRVTRGGWIELAAFFVDQAAHISILWIVARFSGAQAPIGGMAAAALRVAIILVLAIYVGAVVEFLVGAALREPGGGFAPIPLAERWPGMVERAAVVLAALLLAPALWITLAGGYVLAGTMARREREARVKQVVSVAWALAVTAMVRGAGV